MRRRGRAAREWIASSLPISRPASASPPPSTSQRSSTRHNPATHAPTVSARSDCCRGTSSRPAYFLTRAHSLRRSIPARARFHWQRRSSDGESRKTFKRTFSRAETPSRQGFTALATKLPYLCALASWREYSSFSLSMTRFLPDWLHRRAQTHANHAALEFEGKALTFAELARRADSFDALLHAHDIAAGDAVATCSTTAASWSR